MPVHWFGLFKVSSKISYEIYILLIRSVRVVYLGTVVVPLQNIHPPIEHFEPEFRAPAFYYGSPCGIFLLHRILF